MSETATSTASVSKPRVWPWLLAVTVPLYILDQVTKFWVVDHFSDPPFDVTGVVKYNSSADPPIVVIDGFFNLVRVHNQGVAWGMGNGSDWAPLVFPFISLAAFILITVGLKKNFFVGKVGMLAVSLLATGILGNLTDRLIQGSRLERMQGAPLWERLKEGYVVDFLDFRIPVIQYHWPSFNVADSCICVAAVLLFLSGLKADQMARKAAENPTKS
ncbi:signal peptidase II [Haloferula luteola]|uniref:Lipoprotein signal peptidase n=1 Tax=Haloferula luteola TaxID=595692 RepID=A0A840VG10_9BACT|nr:signal peptidase II [Haloferula luteola]MBB5352760.1 signal peptidase II [Haloferula luteola]